MATNADTQNKDETAKAAPVAPASDAAPATSAEKTTTQTFFVPEYGVSVEAASLDEAIEKAKESEGVK